LSGEGEEGVGLSNPSPSTTPFSPIPSAAVFSPSPPKYLFNRDGEEVEAVAAAAGVEDEEEKNLPRRKLEGTLAPFGRRRRVTASL